LLGFGFFRVLPVTREEEAEVEGERHAEKSGVTPLHTRTLRHSTTRTHIDTGTGTGIGTDRGMDTDTHTHY